MSSKKYDRIEKIRRKIASFPKVPGLYFMKDQNDKVLYIGKAKNLRARVASYFQSGEDLVSSRGPWIVEMVSRVQTIDYLETDNEVDAILKEARLIKDIHPPYNSDLVDDKTFPYLEITTRDDFPGVYVTRKPRVTSTRLFGPFTSAKELRAIVVELQRIFKFRTCRLDIREDDPKRIFFRPCILYSIKQCTAPCAANIEKSEYKKIIRDLITFLKSKRSTVLRSLQKQMEEASEKLEYENAAMFRDRIRLIERLDRRGEPDQDVQPEVFVSEPSEALEKLQKILGLAQPVRIIEGIDAAHVSGSEAVGSLVKFIDGRPFKSGYRRFKIKTVRRIDDYAMISEIVRRRYKHAMAGEELWPDLVLIDGGAGQLHAAQNALKELKESSKKQISDNKVKKADTKVAALAKREEELYLQGSEPLKLARTNPALKLLQYVRDEAHRFAQHYHHILRSKKILKTE